MSVAARAERIAHNESARSSAAEHSISSRFAQISTLHSDRIAVFASGAEWTYTELDQRSHFIACEILNRLGDKSEPVALLMEHSAPLIAAIFATLKAGKIYLVLDPGHDRERLAVTLADSRAQLVVTDTTNATLASSLAGTQLQVLEIGEDMDGLSVNLQLPEISPKAGAGLMYTSGSTGKPKGVWQNHAGIVHHADTYRELAEIKPEDRLSLLTPCSLSAAASALFGALLNGATLCPFHVRSQGVEHLALWLREKQVTVYHSVPTVFRQLARTAPEKNVFEKLRLLRLGGEPVLRGDVELFRQLCPGHCRLMNSLSSTETGLISALLIDQETALPGARVPAGNPPRGVEIFLLDEHGQPVKNGDEGRIAVRSMHLRHGYWMQPEATAEKFRADPDDSKKRIFFSNDLGRFLPDGSLEHLGRMDSVVKIRGLRVDLSELEAALHATDLFEEAVALASESEAGQMRLIAYVVPRAGADVSLQNCRRALRQSLPEHMLPADFVPLSRLPQTSGGKIDRRALPSQPRRPASSGEKLRDQYEVRLGVIWRKALGADSIGPRDDFFELGGDSLRSVQVLLQIEQAFKVTLPPSTLVEHSTIESLAAMLSNRAVVRTPSPLVPLRTATSGLPLFLIHPGRGDVMMYGQLARRLPDRPIYGLQAVGLQAEGLPSMKISTMARRYLEEIFRVAPDGPYLLAGSCAGGLVAFEMARQLNRAGKPVGMVALLNSNFPHPRGTAFKRAQSTARDALRMWRWSFMRAAGLGRGERWLPAYRRFVQNMHTHARRFYRPTFYPGTITLFMTNEEPHPGGDPRLAMGAYARQTRLFKITGERRALYVPPGLDELARQLHLCMEEAGSG